MIKITISRTKLGSIQSFKMTGHADYAPHGQDLVCAGTTAVVFGSINAVEELCNVQATIELGSDGGFLTYELPNDLDVHTVEKHRYFWKDWLFRLRRSNLITESISV